MKTDPGSRAKDPSRLGGADSGETPNAFFRRKLGEDADFRRAVATDPRAAFVEQGLDVPPGVELRVAADTDDVFHFVFPADPNAALEDEMLSAISGGRASTAGSAGCLGCASTAPSCLGSASSSSTLSSIAS